MLVKQKVTGVFKKMSTKQEIVSDAAFKAWLFSFNFNFACKDGHVTTATCKYYCPLFLRAPS